MDFSDLIPQQPVAQSAAAPVTFDDLVPAKPSGTPVSPLSAIGRGIWDPAAGTAQFLAHSLPSGVIQGIDSGLGAIRQAIGLPQGNRLADADSRIKQTEADYQAQRASAGQTGIDWYRGGGNVIGTAPLALAMPAATSLGGAALTGAAGGAISGAMEPVANGAQDFWKDKARQAEFGAASGAVFSPMMTWFGKVVNPAVSPEVKTLLDNGITPTPGQAIGGMAKRIEDAATSIPVLGDAIKSGQRRAVMQFNKAAVNQALDPIGGKLPKNTYGNDAIAYAEQSLGDAYKNVLDRIGTIIPDQKFNTDMNGLSALTQGLAKDKGEQFDRIMQNEVWGRLDNGAFPSENVKAAESQLGRIARGYMGNDDYDTQKLGTAVLQAQQNLRDMIARTNPQEAGDLQAINNGWAYLKRAQRASASTGAESGIFSPAQYHTAVKALDPSKDNSAFARGTALGQDLSAAGKSVLGSSVPDSGTPLRHAIQLGFGGLVGHSVLPESVSGAMIPAAGAIGAGSLAYTPWGQWLATRALTQRPTAVTAPLQRMLGQAAPSANAGLLSLLLQ